MFIINVKKSCSFLIQCKCFIYFAAPVFRLEIFLYSSRNGLLDVKTLLLLLDHKTLSGSIDYCTMKTLWNINVRFFLALLARRCKVSYLVHQYINYYISMYM